MIHVARRVVQEELGKDPYIIGIIGKADERNMRLANLLPLDALTGYGLLPNWLGDPVQEYSDLIEQRIREWRRLQDNLAIPFYPVVCAGWDATPRARKGRLSRFDGYPYTPVVVGVTPELFGLFIDHALEFNRAFQPRENIVFLHAWNEWTETSVLEPSDRFSTALLEQVKLRSGLFRRLPIVERQLSETRLPQ